jgi:uncharacterized protein
MRGDAMTGAPLALERIEILDVLRGFALLGMLIVHFHVRSSDGAGIDDFIRTAVWRLVESKSHATFALLFGAGFAVQLRRAQSRGGPFAARYLRRVATLAVFGFMAHAGFGFNVLLGYAVWGVALLVIGRWSTRALWVTAALSAASVGLLVLATMTWQRWTGGPEAARAAFEASSQRAIEANRRLHEAERQPHYGVLLAARLQHMKWFYQQPFFVMPGVTLVLFIGGLLFVRHGLFEEPGRHRGVLGGLAAFGLASWLLANWILPENAPTFGLIREQWLAFSYIGLALLVLAMWPALLARPGIAAAGRMALTNYLLQIAVLDIVFSGYGLGVGSLRAAVMFPASLLAFVLMVLCSVWWLRRFQFGPAEWLWRSATYGEWQSLRRRAIPAALAPT